MNDAVRAHAEWFAWAKRQKADFGRAHGAARQAVAAAEAGMPPPEVENAAREALKAGDTTPVDETRQAMNAALARDPEAARVREAVQGAADTSTAPVVAERPIIPGSAWTA